MERLLLEWAVLLSIFSLGSCSFDVSYYVLVEAMNDHLAGHEWKVKIGTGSKQAHIVTDDSKLISSSGCASEHEVSIRKGGLACRRHRRASEIESWRYCATSDV